MKILFFKALQKNSQIGLTLFRKVNHELSKTCQYFKVIMLKEAFQKKRFKKVKRQNTLEGGGGRGFEK